MGESFMLLITVLLVGVINVVLRGNIVNESLAYILNFDGDFLIDVYAFDEGRERVKGRCRSNLRRGDLKVAVGLINGTTLD